MTFILLAILGIALAISAVLLVLYLTSLKRLKRFESIRDVEAYKAECNNDAAAAIAEVKASGETLQRVNHEIDKQKKTVSQYQQYLGSLQTAAELKQRIETDQARSQKIAKTLGNLERASQLKTLLIEQEREAAKKNAELNELKDAIGNARSASEIAAKVMYYENLLAQLRADIESVEEAGRMQEFGFYNSKFDFDSSQRYKLELDSARKSQKDMLKAKTACVCHTEWQVDGSKREGKKMTNQKIKLMLRAFNGECDAAVGSVKYNNVVAMEKRIQRSFDAVNKLGESSKAYITEEFFQLKKKELFLLHEYHEKKHEEKEEQKHIREQMREEEKVAKEIEKATKDAENEETIKARALEQARKELAEKSGRQTEKLASLVSKLELELQEAIDRKAKAIARAQLTRSGHVYVLSNIGTFGHDVYKIGLTRRLEPLDRVKELGGASVPFPFDVHAMIYCEDAPALENTLHKHFAARRVNMVNLRREFFEVSLDEIREAVAQHHAEVTFVVAPEAEQYRKTLALRKEAQTPEVITAEPVVLAKRVSVPN